MKHPRKETDDFRRPQDNSECCGKRHQHAQITDDERIRQRQYQSGNTKRVYAVYLSMHYVAAVGEDYHNTGSHNGTRKSRHRGEPDDDDKENN